MRDFRKTEKAGIKETRSIWNEIYEWVDCIVITVICILLFFTFVFRQVKIDGSSMEKTLYDGQRLIVSDMFYTPEYGDIVVISSEIYGDIPIIKRVIATEGQWVNIEDGIVYVGNTADTMVPVGSEYVGDIFTESVVGHNSYGSQDYPFEVPEGKVFLLGDNRSVSLDSRTKVIDCVDTRCILGKALYRVYPFDKIGSIY